MRAENQPHQSSLLQTLQPGLQSAAILDTQPSSAKRPQSAAALVSHQKQQPENRPPTFAAVNLCKGPPDLELGSDFRPSDPQQASRRRAASPDREAAALGTEATPEASLNAGILPGQANLERHRDADPIGKQQTLAESADAEMQARQASPPLADQSYCNRDGSVNKRQIEGRSVEACQGAHSCQQREVSCTPLTQHLQENYAGPRQPRGQNTNARRRSALLLATLSPSASDGREEEPIQARSGNFPSTCCHSFAMKPFWFETSSAGN